MLFSGLKGWEAGLKSATGKMLNNKAQVETQFNWIFILIVGAVILIFFTGIVIKQKSSSEAKISESVITDLESIFTGGSLSTGTSQMIETPNVDIRFDCTGYDIKGVKKTIANMILFAPSTVKGRNILTWNLDFNMPYKITGFLYITSPEMRYIFVGYKPEDISRMNSTLPKNMNIEFVSSMNEIKDKNNYRVRLIAKGQSGGRSGIFDGAAPQSIKNMKDRLSALLITGNKLTFYSCDSSGNFRKTGDTLQVDITGSELEPSLYGAIFTDNIEMYNCMMGKALERAYFVSKVYSDRNNAINEYYKTTSNQCKDFIHDFSSYPDNIKEIYPYFSSGQISQQQLTELGTKIGLLQLDAQGIANHNSKVLIQRSCPLIY